MDDDVRELLVELIRRAGSIVQASELIGVSGRRVQSWVSGHSLPSPASVHWMRVALDGDHISHRASRIEGYARRVACGKRLFGEGQR